MYIRGFIFCREVGVVELNNCWLGFHRRTFRRPPDSRWPFVGFAPFLGVTGRLQLLRFPTSGSDVYLVGLVAKYLGRIIKQVIFYILFVSNMNSILSMRSPFVDWDARIRTWHGPGKGDVPRVIAHARCRDCTSGRWWLRLWRREVRTIVRRRRRIWSSLGSRTFAEDCVSSVWKLEFVKEQLKEQNRKLRERS